MRHCMTDLDVVVQWRWFADSRLAPVFILPGILAFLCFLTLTFTSQDAIELAEKGDFSRVMRLLQVLSHPFDEQPDAESEGFAAPPPPHKKGLICSCSS